MKYVIYIDNNGYKRRVMLRDTDSDEKAPYGIPAGPPPELMDLDCELMRREINNLMVENGLFTWEDINNSPLGLRVVETVVKRFVKSIYIEQANLEKKRIPK